MNVTSSNTAGRHRRTTAINKSGSQPPAVTSPIIPRLLLGLAFGLTVFGIGMFLDRVDLRNVLLAVALLSIFALIQAIRPRRRSSVVAPHLGPQSLASALVRGSAWGVVFAALMAVLLPLTALIPTPETWSDRDRRQTEQQIETLTSAGNFDAAATVVDKRLKGSMSTRWRAAMQLRHLDLLVSAGEKAPTSRAKADYWHRAAVVAATYGIDDRLPHALLGDNERHHKLQVLLNEATSRLSPEARDALLRAVIKHVPKEHWPNSLPQALVDNLLQWAKATSHLSERRERLSTAVAECGHWGLNPELAQFQLLAVERELAALAPAVLPPNTKVRLVGGSTAADPALAFDVAVETAAGQPLVTLSAKDLIVTSAGQRIAAQQVSRRLHSSVSDLAVVILLDYSPSTDSVRGAAHTGAVALASSAPRGTKFRVLAFHEKVVPVTDWTDRLTEIDSRLRTFHTLGRRTALRAAVPVAVAELAARPGARVLVIFTDGRDTAGDRISDAELVKQCRAQGIRVMAIGLESSDLDTALLTALAEGTGGRYLAASRQEELVERFRALQLQQTTSVYRVALLTSPGIRWPLELVVGGGTHAVHINLPRSISQ